ncbi:S1 RNA-binding domain-containing protein [Pediococcus acidilactici]|uniref:S1 RNA-binding domain-containing protein n=1 Tax=Pediococcus acidilactici TaxID=1254 RepID=UPI00132B8704|nr:S1 RNA-binding domain-containing protein [Pediococcus acidilactici]KAF0333631.1 S1 RNA-binding domain-containing protein [Pediococcus acidilactici]KAF0336297.1 S1 RNA-binding domain-containing protein [Pediococcus acidilactici]KAF0337772.1 S1 RNA-binding domain-containing protein [Pediococcus acidilactici]KAF0343258.1 S1 RNA-binding domain-containing protein [Pediococcus acidilactici]KAF0348080.1 S1 RNA-binding domain-containing protein [Pediococcus acidilactici]
MYKLGEILEVKIVGIRDYGLFIQDKKGRKGLIHVSECDNQYIRNMHHAFDIGEKVQAVVMEDDGNRRFALSIRALKETKGNLSKYPRPINFYVNHKHFWTKSHHDAGFKPLAEHLEGWKAEKLK